MKKLLLVIGLLFSLNLFAGEDIKPLRVNAVHDGDTFTVDLNCSIKTVCNNIPIRVSGIDTPEISSNGPIAIKAKIQTTRYVYSAGEDLVLKDCFRDKYFRLNCSVENGTAFSLKDVLIDMGLAKPYNGGKKDTNWSNQ